MPAPQSFLNFSKNPKEFQIFEICEECLECLECLFGMWLCMPPHCGRTWKDTKPLANSLQEERRSLKIFKSHFIRAHRQHYVYAPQCQEGIFGEAEIGANIGIHSYC